MPPAGAPERPTKRGRNRRGGGRPKRSQRGQRALARVRQTGSQKDAARRPKSMALSSIPARDAAQMTVIWPSRRQTGIRGWARPAQTVARTRPSSRGPQTLVLQSLGEQSIPVLLLVTAVPMTMTRAIRGTPVFHLVGIRKVATRPLPPWGRQPALLPRSGLRKVATWPLPSVCVESWG